MTREKVSITKSDDEVVIEASVQGENAYARARQILNDQTNGIDESTIDRVEATIRANSGHTSEPKGEVDITENGSQGNLNQELSLIRLDSGGWACPLDDCDFTHPKQQKVASHVGKHKQEAGVTPSNKSQKKDYSFLTEDDREFKPIEPGTNYHSVLQVVSEEAPSEDQAKTRPELSIPDSVHAESVPPTLSKLYQRRLVDRREAQETSAKYEYWISDYGDAVLRDMQDIQLEELRSL